MSLLVLGLSHRDAPLDLLERISLDATGRAALATAVAGSEHVAETVVVSTCNRTEVYVEAVTFHGAVAAVTDALAAVSGIARAELTARLAVHFEDRAIAHAFRVASGLDSMALGESQIRAQLRGSLSEAQQQQVVGPALQALFQRALRVGKRVHTDTPIETVSRSLVADAYQEAAATVGPLTQARVLVLGAGAMAALAATTAYRAGVGRLTIANRTVARAQALAERLDGHAVALADLAEHLPEADIIVSCIGAQGLVVSTEAAAAAARADHPQVYVDLGLPHDIAHEVGQLPGIRRLGLDALAALQASADAGDPVLAQASDLVTAEVAAFLTARAELEAAPAIAALRRRAAATLDAELARLSARTPGLSDQERREVEIAMGRLVDKMLHGTTVRVKELAASGRIGEYAQALTELFDLDPQTVASVSRPPRVEVSGFAGELPQEQR